MSEVLYKFDPTRTIHLRGVSGYGAAAAIHSTSSTGFTVTGVFRDMADFAVIMLYDADNFFEHYSFKYVPDFDMTNLVLGFTANWSSALAAPDHLFYDWNNFTNLCYETASGVTGTISLLSLTSSTGTAATTSIIVSGSGLQAYDRTTVFLPGIGGIEYIVPGPLSCSFSYYASGSGTQHTLTIGSTTYTYTEVSGDGSTDVAAGLVALSSADSNATTANAANILTVTRKLDTGDSLVCSASDGNGSTTIYQVYDTTVAEYIKVAINAADYSGALTALTAARSGTTITVTTDKKCSDCNRFVVYESHKTSTLYCTVGSFTGGASPASWDISIPFSSLSIPSIRRLWLTLAPAMPQGQAHAESGSASEWTFTVSSLSVVDPDSHRRLFVAATGSLRVDSRSPRVSYSGSWTEVAGWFQRGFARTTDIEGDSVTITYTCPHAHSLYLGTAVCTGHGSFSIEVDDTPQSAITCGTSDESILSVRRLISSTLLAGKHSVTLTVVGSSSVYFDFLEAVVLGDPSDAPAVYTSVSAAVDYDTDHGYKLPPERVLWILNSLGFQGQINLYCGVFWWNQRKRGGTTCAYADVEFSGTPTVGGSVFLYFGLSGGTPSIGRVVASDDTLSSLAHYFVGVINQTFIACWAEYIGGTGHTGLFRIHQHAPTWVVYLSATNTADLTITGASDIAAQSASTWLIDSTATEPINIGARSWLSDFFSRVNLLNWGGCVASFSMELVNPDEGTLIYAARFPDGTPVETATGFGSLVSTHCAFTPDMLSLHKAAFLSVAGLMDDAGLTPYLQFGEFVWWYQARRTLIPSAVSNTSPIEIYFSSPHTLSTGATVINAGYKGNTAATGTYTATVINTYQISLDGTVGNGSWTAGTGRTSTGGMAFYDEYTKAYAQTVLGRDLATFWTSDDDPTINSGEDVSFLMDVLEEYMRALKSHVTASYSGARFELLFPLDVTHNPCYYTDDRPYPQGGRLNNSINLPPAAADKFEGIFNQLKTEALSWGAYYLNQTLAREASDYADQVLNWSATYILPWYNGACAWEHEYLMTQRDLVWYIVFWALDHICLMGWPVPLPEESSTVVVC